MVPAHCGPVESEPRRTNLEGFPKRFPLPGTQKGFRLSEPETLLFQLLMSRGDRRWTFPNDLTGMRLFHAAIALARPFAVEELEILGRGQAL